MEQLSAKEKAKQLIQKYYQPLSIHLKINNNNNEMWDYAKQCALIAVDEILEFMKTDDEKHDCCSWCNSPELSYWLKVKEEIKNL